MFNEQQRKSYIEVGDVCFWTATLHNWIPLLQNNEVKDIIIDSLKNLSGRGLATVYGFVIMLNHIHLIWRVNGTNGKESVQASFLKYTAHAFKKWLEKKDPALLHSFKVQANNKSYEFWKRDSLAFKLKQRDTAIQKLEYIHNNPVAKNWSLASTREAYYYSSAKFYECGIDEFGFLEHIMGVL
jgi:REP element-mobilizing transposase RayT